MLELHEFVFFFPHTIKFIFFLCFSFNWLKFISADITEIKKVIEDGANVNARYEDNETPLLLAVNTGKQLLLFEESLLCHHFKSKHFITLHVDYIDTLWLQ